MKLTSSYLREVDTLLGQLSVSGERMCTSTG